MGTPVLQSTNCSQECPCCNQWLSQVEAPTHKPWLYICAFSWGPDSFWSNQVTQNNPQLSFPSSESHVLFLSTLQQLIILYFSSLSGGKSEDQLLPCSWFISSFLYLYNWKTQNSLFSEKLQVLISLLKTFFKVREVGRFFFSKHYQEN